jgi:predicted alpha-1,6-mannanase (GH76 family)
MSGHLTPWKGRSTYVNEAVTGINVLQQWYDQHTGLWKTTGWWNSANCLTVLADFALLAPGSPIVPQIANVIANTYANAQLVSVRVTKSLRERDWLVRSTYTLSRGGGDNVAEQGFPGFINEYYDDEGWWALALLHSYDFTGDATYLRAAEGIFADMAGGEDSTCGGGIWWSKARTYKNAIANELYLAVAAALANRAGSAAQRSGYLQVATAQWGWFRQSGMINAQGTINDGLVIHHGNGTCSNNGATAWSYNQGVIIGALVELHRATGDASLLESAAGIAAAAIARLTDSDGILHEPCEPDCGADGSQFKGIFVRNLGYLQAVAPQNRFPGFISKNADSIVQSDTDAAHHQYGLVWSGPPTAGGRADASTHSSALDAIVAAVAVS